MLYLMLDLEGPHQFAELPRKTQAFWTEWFNERARRAKDNNQPLTDQISNFT